MKSCCISMHEFNRNCPGGMSAGSFVMDAPEYDSVRALHSKVPPNFSAAKLKPYVPDRGSAQSKMEPIPEAVPTANRPPAL
eukprot:COSAG02_NODE_8955_length_2383_cov_1.641419_2_plen_81_part_00